MRTPIRCQPLSNIPGSNLLNLNIHNFHSSLISSSIQCLPCCLSSCVVMHCYNSYTKLRKTYQKQSGHNVRDKNKQKWRVSTRNCPSSNYLGNGMLRQCFLRSTSCRATIFVTNTRPRFTRIRGPWESSSHSIKRSRIST